MILDPASVIDDLDIRQEPKVVPFRRLASSPLSTGGAVDAIKDQIIAEYHAIPSGTGQRHHGFFMACLKLYTTGFSIYDVETMMPELDYDGSRKAKNEYQGVLKSLPKYGRSTVA